MSAIRRWGYSLIEAIAALAVLGLVVVAALQVAAADARASRNAAAAVRAATLAEQLLARAQLALPMELQALSTTTPQRFAAPMDAYQWTLQLENSVADPHLVDLHARVWVADVTVQVSARLASERHHR